MKLINKLGQLNNTTDVPDNMKDFDTGYGGPSENHSNPKFNIEDKASELISAYITDKNATEDRIEKSFWLGRIQGIQDILSFYRHSQVNAQADMGSGAVGTPSPSETLSPSQASELGHSMDSDKETKKEEHKKKKHKKSILEKFMNFNNYITK